jgi:hypothetical protein
MNETLESFVLWSGWIAAVGIAIYEIVRAYRNRTKILISLTITGDALCIGVHNWGRRTVTFVEAGLLFTNGKETSYDERDPEFPLVLFSKDGFNLCFKLKDVIKELKSGSTEIQYGYFTDAEGKIYKKNLNDEYKSHIKELIATTRNTSNLTHK